jgi:uncharacterized paraquat-inducible protein A
MDDEETEQLDAAAMRMAGRLVEQLIAVCKTPDFAMLVAEEMVRRLQVRGAKTEAEYLAERMQEQIDEDLAAGRLERACQTCDASMPPDGPPCPACGSTGAVVLRAPVN